LGDWLGGHSESPPSPAPKSESSLFKPFTRMGLTPARLASSAARGEGGTTSESGEFGEQEPRQRKLRHRQVSPQQEDDWRCERQRLKGHRWQVDCSDEFQHNPSPSELA